MPAAAVIPAPIAYIKVVAVKKLVVGFRAGTTSRPSFRGFLCWFSLGFRLGIRFKGEVFARVLFTGFKCQFSGLGGDELTSRWSSKAKS